MAFDYRKLKGRIIEKYGSQLNFADAYGISENTLSLKMRNKVIIRKEQHRQSHKVHHLYHQLHH